MSSSLGLPFTLELLRSFTALRQTVFVIRLFGHHLAQSRAYLHRLAQDLLSTCIEPLVNLRVLA